MTYLLVISFYSPDSHTLYKIDNPVEFWQTFDSFDDWAMSEDYLDFVTEVGLTGPDSDTILTDGISKIHVYVMEG